VKAVNLIPTDARKGGAGISSSVQLVNYGLFGALAVGLVLVTLYVLASNSVSSQQAKLTDLRAQVTQAQSEVSQLGSYASFQKLASSRIQTVEGIAATRFDWHKALTGLSRVVPANTSLQSLVATAAPGASAGGNAGGTPNNLRSAISNPAFELVGCTSTQDDVARLMSRLRLVEGVSRVTLGDSQKTAGATPGAAISGAPGSATAAVGCGPDKPSFDIVVFFQPLTGAGPQGATSLGTVTTTGGVR
jgi:Tfp pilus assembly protein PilN